MGQDTTSAEPIWGLPVELHKHIISYLGYGDLMCLWFTCRHFRDLVTNHLENVRRSCKHGTTVEQFYYICGDRTPSTSMMSFKNAGTKSLLLGAKRDQWISQGWIMEGVEGWHYGRYDRMCGPAMITRKEKHWYKDGRRLLVLTELDIIRANVRTYLEYLGIS